MTRSQATIVGLAHVASAMLLSISLRIFITPPEQIASVPPQPVRYVIYAGTLLAVAIAAGSVLGGFLVGRSWIPAVYLWLLPFGIVALPAINSDIAGFVYLGFTEHVGAGLAALAALDWVLGVGIGTGVSLKLSLDTRGA